jgi:hypothetical protein
LRTDLNIFQHIQSHLKMEALLGVMFKKQVFDLKDVDEARKIYMDKMTLTHLSDEEGQH